MTRLLVTVCPACATRFRITDAQLQVAGGRVRCGACLDVFDALPNVEDVDAATANSVAQSQRAPQREAKDGATTSAADSAGAAREPRFTVVGTDVMPPSESVGAGASSADNPVRRRSVLDIDTDPSSLTPEERRRLAQLGVEVDLSRAPARRWRLVAPMSVAVVLLLFQYLYFRSDAVASSTTLRPWYERLCSVVGCTVPPFRDNKLLHSGSVVMRVHPTRPDVLLIDAQIVNEAPYPQPFPDVLVEILDKSGATLSSRVFTPMDYRRGELATMPLVPTQRPLQLSLQVFKPSNASVNFRFELMPAVR